MAVTKKRWVALGIALLGLLGYIVGCRAHQDRMDERRNLVLVQYNRHQFAVSLAEELAADWENCSGKSSSATACADLEAAVADVYELDTLGPQATNAELKANLRKINATIKELDTAGDAVLSASRSR